MKIQPGITTKLFLWHLSFMLMFCGTILVLYLNIREIRTVSEKIINKHYVIASESKNMIENLLTMEENERKYLILRRIDYLEYFLAAQRDFETGFDRIFTLESTEMVLPGIWLELRQSYQKFRETLFVNPNSLELWISESIIMDWIQKITAARTENENQLELANRNLNELGRNAVKIGMIGLAVSLGFGIFGGLFLSQSMVLPLRELLRGIRSIAEKGATELISVSTKDEFEVVASAFNDMAINLEHEKQMRSDFISMLSHEIRTPLTSIREAVSLIAEGIMGDINERQHRFLGIAKDEIERVCLLLNRLIEVWRMESVELKIQPSAMGIAEYINGCIEQVAPLAEKKNIRIETHLPETISSIMGDKGHLQQVLFNILDNSIKFSPSDSRIVIRVRANDAFSKLEFTITDEGPGIPEDEQKFIFNKYYRAKRTRDHIDGVGLGLSICKHIIEIHGGIVWITSTPGQGSTFGFSLPIK